MITSEVSVVLETPAAAIRRYRRRTVRRDWRFWCHAPSGLIFPPLLPRALPWAGMLRPFRA